MEESTSRLYEAKALYIISQVTGLGEATARELIRSSGGIWALARTPEQQLRQFSGIGPRRAAKLSALTEWALLLGQLRLDDNVIVRSPSEVANLLMLEMGLLDREELRIISLDTRNRVISINTIYKGSLNSALIRICEVMKFPILSNAASFILIHNHPSGDPDPSPEDVRITMLIRESATQLDLDFMDHLIIGRNRFVSLKERGLGF